MIKVENLSKAYKKNLAVKDVSFEVPVGSVYGLIGLNGAGKTTIIKTVTGLIKKFSGNITVCGIEWGRKDYRRNFVFLPELFTPHHFLTGWEYISFMNSLHDAGIDRDKTLALAEKLAFEPALLNKKCRTYSKGTAQKLGLIQVLSTPAKLLIFDEPMSGLDPLARAQFKSALIEAHEQGHTVFLSTHILHDIDTMCTHLGVINKGELLFSGTPSGFKEKNEVADLEKAFLKEIAK
ncbi:MAG: ABC transporter ATP-binding protein [Deferribacteraceae bacterium]|jgi:ABC-2 type transport system ATP-binding protein|nr:ABC transporter ATP-binding protein [Deferribacteraceae bacterium]